MAITYITEVDATTTVAGATLTSTPANSVGNLVLGWFIARNATGLNTQTYTVTDTGGNVWHEFGGGILHSTNEWLDFYYSITTAISGTLSWTASGTNAATNANAFYTQEFHSTLGWSGPDSSAGAGLATGTANTAIGPAAPANPTVQNNEVAFAIAAQFGATPTWSGQTAGYTVGTGQTSNVSGASIHFQSAYQILSATGSQTYSATSSVSALWQAGLVCFKETVAGGTGYVPPRRKSYYLAI